MKILQYFGDFFTYFQVSKKFSANCKNSIKESEFNIESAMVELVLKPLIDRLIEMKTEITNQENLVKTLKINFNINLFNSK